MWIRFLFWCMEVPAAFLQLPCVPAEPQNPKEVPDSLYAQSVQSSKQSREENLILGAAYLRLLSHQCNDAVDPVFRPSAGHHELRKKVGPGFSKWQ